MIVPSQMALDADGAGEGTGATMNIILARLRGHAWSSLVKMTQGISRESAARCYQ